MKKTFIMLCLVLFLSIGCSRNVDEVKLHASDIFKSNGFEIVGYQGYQLSPIFGGRVWYTLKKGDISYQAALIQWFDEYHIYDLAAIDAIKPIILK